MRNIRLQLRLPCVPGQNLQLARALIGLDDNPGRLLATLFRAHPAWQRYVRQLSRANRSAQSLGGALGDWAKCGSPKTFYGWRAGDCDLGLHSHDDPFVRQRLYSMFRG